VRAHVARVALLALASLPVATVAAGAVTRHAPFLPVCASAAWTHHVALVIEHGNGAVIRLCIGFDSVSISGEDVLRASGLEFATANFGSLGDAVCQIDSEPSTYPPSCFSSSSPYWVLFVSRGGSGWGAADHGVSNEQFSDGDAQGFRYDPQSGSPSPPVSAAGTCPVTAATNAPAPSSTGAVHTPTAHPSTTQPSSATPPAVAGGTATASAQAAVVSPASTETPPDRPVHSVASALPASGAVNAGLIVAIAAAVALLGLLAVQLIRSRRPA
jgi:hypothetical protein